MSNNELTAVKIQAARDIVLSSSKDPMLDVPSKVLCAASEFLCHVFYKTIVNPLEEDNTEEEPSKEKVHPNIEKRGGKVKDMYGNVSDKK